MTSPTVALGLAEGGRLARNPLIWLSLLPTAMWVRSTAPVSDGEDRLILLTGYGLLLAGFVMIAAVVMATLRGRIEHTEELLATLAVGPDRRSIGHAVSTLALGGVGVVVTAATYVVLRPADPLGSWEPSDGRALDVPRPNLAQLAQGPLALVAVATFVIALVRWVPTWLVLGPLLFLLMVQGLWMGLFHGVPASGGRWLFPLGTGVVNGPWTGCGPEDTACDLAVSGFDRVTPWWHAAYLVALATWFTTIAVLRHRRDSTAWAWFGATLAAVTATGAIQLAVADGFVPT